MNWTRVLLGLVLSAAICLPVMAQEAPAADESAVADVTATAPESNEGLSVEAMTVVQKSAPVPDEFTPSGVLGAVLFYAFAALTLAAGLAICLAKNIVRMAVFLFITLGSVAVLYFLLLANFIAVIQLIVYAGGTLILLVFGVMLTSKSPWAKFESNWWEMGAAGAVCFVFAAVLVAAMLTASWPQTDQVVQVPTVAEFGTKLLTTYLVPFEAVSVLLLAVMIGAAYLARQE